MKTKKKFSHKLKAEISWTRTWMPIPWFAIINISYCSASSCYCNGAAGIFIFGVHRECYQKHSLHDDRSRRYFSTATTTAKSHFSDSFSKFDHIFNLKKLFEEKESRHISCSCRYWLLQEATEPENAVSYFETPYFPINAISSHDSVFVRLPR